MILVGLGIRHFMNAQTLLSRIAFAGAFALFFYTAPASPSQTNPNQQSLAVGIPFESIYQIMQARCSSCHNPYPSDDVFQTASQGILLESLAQIKNYAQLIKSHTVDTQTMPLSNTTGMSSAERQQLGLWIAQSAP